MLIGIWWCARRPEWCQKLPAGESSLCAQMPQNSMVLMIQWWLNQWHNWNCVHVGVPHKVSIQPMWYLWNQRRACTLTTHVQRCLCSPHQPSLPLCTSVSSSGLLLSSSCTCFSRPYPTPLCCSGPQHPTPGAGLPDTDRGAAERSSAPEWRAGVLYPPPGTDRSFHLQPGKGLAQLSVCRLFVWELSPALSDACAMLKLYNWRRNELLTEGPSLFPFQVTACGVSCCLFLQPEGNTGQ